jgi:hypothetical protein
LNYISKHSDWLGICQPTNGDLLKLLLRVGQSLSQAARWPAEDPESKIKRRPQDAFFVFGGEVAAII